MDSETLEAFARLARNFAQREVREVVARETRDGDPTRLSHLLIKAEETGLMSSPNPDHPGS